MSGNVGSRGGWGRRGAGSVNSEVKRVAVGGARLKGSTLAIRQSTFTLSAVRTHRVAAGTDAEEEEEEATDSPALTINQLPSERGKDSRWAAREDSRSAVRGRKGNLV